MSKRTLTRADLCETVYENVGLSRSESQRLVETVLEEISKALVRGESVKLSGFGTFHVRQKAERIGRNPKTKKDAIITPRRVLSFKASNMLKAEMNGEEVGTED